MTFLFFSLANNLETQKNGVQYCMEGLHNKVFLSPWLYWETKQLWANIPWIAAEKQS